MNVDPFELLKSAQAEPLKVRASDLRAVLPAMQYLKDTKGFSYREIAAWLCKCGIRANVGHVYRAMHKTKP